jgi:hypothetical protein
MRGELRLHLRKFARGLISIERIEYKRIKREREAELVIKIDDADTRGREPTNLK